MVTPTIKISLVVLAALTVAGCASSATDYQQLVMQDNNAAALPANAPSVLSERTGQGWAVDGDLSLPMPQAEPATSNVITEPTQTQADDRFARGMNALRAGDIEGAITDLQWAADHAGHTEAQYELARLLTKGDLVQQDPTLAAYYLDASAQGGNPEAIRVQAWQMIKSATTDLERQQGEAMMQLAATRSQRAMRELGLLYLGEYEPSLNKPAEGERYLEMAALAGDVESAVILAKLARKSGDTAKADEWVAHAAVLGGPAQEIRQPQQQNHFDQAQALLLKPSRSLEDEAKAYVLMLLAAEAGNEMAGKELAHLEGVKVLMDRQEAGWEERLKADLR